MKSNFSSILWWVQSIFFAIDFKALNLTFEKLFEKAKGKISEKVTWNNWKGVSCGKFNVNMKIKFFEMSWNENL